ncbi:YihY/virulence factor BrkB family protein [Rufibacter immobilis]|uniref:YihY/virulence factor BrkB family protein n=1 Tax=Rufibacter immobilis TaxID=1348778 RepID=A0A3M9MWA7_9BACT|nr:YihY/virulence factor BrkB family protein [Rufibacter immobilis]RNI29445.1 YihY/virulence factor BrkB family protein [Rufibacter immobilis]
MIALLPSHLTTKVQPLLTLFKEAFGLFRQNDPLRLASSTAFFTLFALPPVLILVISLLGILFNDALITGELFEKLTGLVGENVASQVELILTNFMDLQGHGWAAALSFLFLTFVSTTLFTVIQNSLNQLWSIRLKGRQHLRGALRNRFRALLIILSSGLLFLGFLMADAVLAFINDHYTLWDARFQLHLLHLVNRIVGLAVETTWFAIIFSFLPFAHVHKRAVWVGAAVTALLFLLGKMVLARLLVNSDLGSVYATSGSIVVLLLFIFYSAMIFYFGACFTRVYARSIDQPLQPKSFATFYEWKDTEQAPLF